MSLLMVVSCFVVAFFVLAAINWIELITWRKSEAEHWTERSRILWPARRTNAILNLYVPVLLAVGSSLFCQAGLIELVFRWLAASAGAVGAGWFVARQLHPGIRWRAWLHEVAITWVLRLGFWLVLLAVGFSMPDEFNRRTCLMLAGVVALQVAWPSIALRLLRVCGIMRPPSERLRKIVAVCTRDGGPRVREIWQAGGGMANALALPLTGTLVFFDRLLEVLSDDEVAAVCSHELGHLSESKWVIAGRYFGAMAILPLLLLKPAVHQWGFAGFMGPLLLMILWARLARRLVHRMETRADAAASHQQSGQGVYASALEKIYQTNHLPAVMPGKQSTHPHLYDRMLAAGTTPGFPRPRAPGKFTLAGWFMLFAGPFTLMWMFSNSVHDDLFGRSKSNHRPSVHRPQKAAEPER